MDCIPENIGVWFVIPIFSIFSFQVEVLCSLFSLSILSFRGFSFASCGFACLNLSLSENFEHMLSGRSFLLF